MAIYILIIRRFAYRESLDVKVINAGELHVVSGLVLRTPEDEGTEEAPATRRHAIGQFGSCILLIVLMLILIIDLPFSSS